MTPRYYLLRAVRFGPLVPARFWMCDSEPDVPENKLDRGRLSVYPRADIAGVEVEPERVAERSHWKATHWAALQPITEAMYRYEIARLRWAEAHRPEDAALRPRRAVDPATVPIPDFSHENNL